MGDLQIDTIKRMLAGDSAMFLRETMGICAEATTRAFREEKVKLLEQRPRAGLPFPASHVYVSVDPAGGGNSAFAMASIVSDGGGGMRMSSLDALLRSRDNEER